MLTSQSTSTLGNHISFVHKNINQSQNEANIECCISNETSASIGIEKYLKRNIRDPNDEMPDYIISFLIDSNLPLSIVESNSFNSLINFVSRNKNCKVPCIKVMKNRMLELETGVSKLIKDEIKSETIAITHDGAKSHNNHNMDTTTCNISIHFLFFIFYFYFFHIMFNV